jgi:hypothetical protein
VDFLGSNELVLVPRCIVVANMHLWIAKHLDMRVLISEGCKKTVPPPSTACRKTVSGCPDKTSNLAEGLVTRCWRQGLASISRVKDGTLVESTKLGRALADPPCKVTSSPRGGDSSGWK